MVESFVDDVWPDGDVGGLHAAAARWRSFGAAAGGMQGALNASKLLFDGQHIPEGAKIDEALSNIGDCFVQVGDLSGKLATKLDSFADQVNQAHSHIRDLLNRLGSLSDLGHDLMLIVKGDALDEIKKIAQDINGVLHDLGREARAAEQGMKVGMQVMDGLVVKFEKYMRGQLKDFLGDAVGNQVATVFDTWLNANEGFLKGAVGMASSMGDLLPVWGAVDPEGYAATWTGLAKNVWKGSLFNALINPEEAGETELQQIKSLLHLEDWSRDRPGLGAGENLFDLATLFVPGAGEAGAAADGAGVAARGAEAEAEAAGAAGRAGGKPGEGLGDIATTRGALSDITKASADLPKNLEGVTKDLPEIKPPTSGSPVALPSGKPIGPAVEVTPRPVDGAPGGAHAPTTAPVPEATRPVATGGPSNQAAAPPSTPAVHGDPHDPAPASPSAGAGDPPAAPHAPTSVPAEVPHEPASVPAGGPREPASVQAEGAHEPAGPVTKGPHEPVSPGGPHEPAPENEPPQPRLVPEDRPRAPAEVPAARAPLAPLDAATGERAPSAIPQMTEYAPGRATSPQGGSPVASAPAAPRSSQTAPPAKPASHLLPPGGRPTGIPAPGRSPHLPVDGGPPSGGPKPALNGGPHGPTDDEPMGGGPQPKPPVQNDAPREPSDKGSDHQHLADHDYPSRTDDFGPDDLSAMDDYTGLGYRDLNDALRGNAVEASQLARIEAIKTALQKLPLYHGPVVRGTDLPPEVLAQYRPGEVITEKAFLSASTNPAVARSTAFSGNVEFRISSKTGRDISSVSLFPGEREILFAPGSHFYVAGKTIDPLTGKTIIEMIER
ncbi:MAG TPA: ADP-ribosyltransferase [Mycobacterium sp.]|nr:ADP-ribosyltransferase [Mycobacterium sp.]